MKISIHVNPNSSLDKIEIKAEIFYITIRSKPIDGAANDYLINYLSKYFGIPRNKIQIVSGKTSKNKIVHIEIDEKEFQAKKSEQILFQKNKVPFP